MFYGKGRIKSLAPYLLHYVRCDIIAAVGYRSSEISNLQRCKIYLTLSDTDRYNRKAVPRALICVVVIVAVRDKSSFLARKVDAELISEAHRHHIVAPYVHGIVGRAVFLPVTNHVIESPTEICIT